MEKEKKKMLLKLYESNKLNIEKCLSKTEEEYRDKDPGQYLYNLVLNYKYEEKFTHEFIELVYVTLCAWNMNSRGAKLSDYDSFKESVLSEKDLFDKLRMKELKNLSEDDFDVLWKLFNDLKLAKTSAKLVTFSKTMHFFLPDTVAPIDRKYTITFYKNNKNIPENVSNQFELYKMIHEDFSEFANSVDLAKYIKQERWDRTVPKIIDNIIIGYQKING